MKAFATALIAALGTGAVMFLYHRWVTAELARHAASTGAGTPLPARLDFLVKLDHFAVLDYGYLLILASWIVAFVLSRAQAGPSTPGGATGD